MEKPSPIKKFIRIKNLQKWQAIQNGKSHMLTHKEAIEKAIYDWNNGIFDTKTKLLHMTEQEKMLWYTEDLLKAAWYGVNVLTESLWWETTWKLRKIAEEQKSLNLSSGEDYDMEVVADELLHDDIVGYKNQKKEKLDKMRKEERDS